MEEHLLRLFELCKVVERVEGVSSLSVRELHWQPRAQVRNRSVDIREHEYDAPHEGNSPSVIGYGNSPWTVVRESQTEDSLI